MAIEHRQRLLLAVLIIFHTVGLLGLMSEQRTYFLSLSSWNLLLALFCVLFSFFRFSFRLFVDVLWIGSIGFLAEWIGVHTGCLFGAYSYGANLGWKLGGIPLIIAGNWVMLSIASTALVANLKLPFWGKAVLSATAMTLLDALIEPVAIASDFWSWTYGTIPFYNYVCWWGLAFPMHCWLLRRKSTEQNIVSVGLFVILTVFFGILNWM